jgi:hypothetical protein
MRFPSAYFLRAMALPVDLRRPRQPTVEKGSSPKDLPEAEKGNGSAETHDAHNFTLCPAARGFAKPGTNATHLNNPELCPIQSESCDFGRH